MSIRLQTHQKLASYSKEITHLMCIEQSFGSYGIDICSFHELHKQDIETNSVFFIKFDQTNISNIQVASVIGAFSTDPELVDLARLLQPDTYLASSKSYNNMHKLFKACSVDCIKASMTDIIVLEDLDDDNE